MRENDARISWSSGFLAAFWFNEKSERDCQFIQLSRPEDWVFPGEFWKLFLISVYNGEDFAQTSADVYRVRIATQKQIEKMKKLMVIVTAVAFVAGLLGFVGCGGIDEDPDAAAAGAKQKLPEPGEDDPDKEDSDDDPEGQGFTPKVKDDTDDDDGDE